MEDFQELTKRMFFSDSNVKRFRTSIVMDRTKANMEVPLHDRPGLRPASLTSA